MDTSHPILQVSGLQDDYEAQIKTGVKDPYPYDRLMIAYRKARQYADELRVVKKAIDVFTKHLESRHDGLLKRHRKRSTIFELSQSISKRTGLLDKKGKALHVPEPIARWEKRKAVIEKKMTALAKKKRPVKKKRK